MTTHPERLLTTREVAEILGLSRATVLRYHAAGRLPGFRLATNVLRFRWSEVARALLLVESTATIIEEREPGIIGQPNLDIVPEQVQAAPQTSSTSRIPAPPTRRPDRAR